MLQNIHQINADLVSISVNINQQNASAIFIILL